MLLFASSFIVLYYIQEKKSEFIHYNIRQANFGVTKNESDAHSFSVHFQSEQPVTACYELILC